MKQTNRMKLSLIINKEPLQIQGQNFSALYNTTHNTVQHNKVVAPTVKLNYMDLH